MSYAIVNHLDIIVISAIAVLYIIVIIVHNNREKNKTLAIRENERIMSLDDMVKDNQFIAKNKEKYEQLMRQNDESLKEEKKQATYFN